MRNRLAIMVIAFALLVVPAVSATGVSDLCPFADDDTPEELVFTTNGVLLQGVCTGSMNVQSVSTYLGSGTTSSNTFALSASHGDVGVIYSSDLRGLGQAANTGTDIVLDFTGNGASMENGFYMSRLANDSCEDVTGGTSAMFTSGGFASSLLASAAPDIGLDLTYQFTTDTGNNPFVGVFRTDYQTNQIYGEVTNDTLTETYSSRTSISSRWAGVSAVSGQYQFTTLVE
ncbi:MAG: hypothetical protein PHH09_08485 [Methanoregulaceae archaeon]|nr:hypothetical protein [Methanoregulaceae archaeon]